MGERIPITVTGKQIIERQIAELEAKAPAIRQALEEAREKGDLNENAEFHAAREALSMLGATVKELGEKLASAQIVDPSRAPRDRVAFGAIVTALNLETDAEETYHLVGLGEDDPAENRVLTTSPIGQCLMLKKKGEEAELTAPRGKVRYRVIDIRYPA